jgi:hypothetical protein
MELTLVVGARTSQYQRPAAGADRVLHLKGSCYDTLHMSTAVSSCLRCPGWSFDRPLCGTFAQVNKGVQLPALTEFYIGAMDAINSVHPSERRFF